jgi:hypothetical protein
MAQQPGHQLWTARTRADSGQATRRLHRCRNKRIGFLNCSRHSVSKNDLTPNGSMPADRPRTAPHEPFESFRSPSGARVTTNCDAALARCEHPAAPRRLPTPHQFVVRADSGAGYAPCIQRRPRQEEGRSRRGVTRLEDFSPTAGRAESAGQPKESSPGQRLQIDGLIGR